MLVVERALDVEAVACLALDQAQLVQADGDGVLSGDVEQGLTATTGAAGSGQDLVADVELHAADALHEAAALGDGVDDALLHGRVGGEVGLHRVEQRDVDRDAGGLGKGTHLGAGERTCQPEPQVHAQAAVLLGRVAEAAGELPVVGAAVPFGWELGGDELVDGLPGVCQLVPCE